MNDYWVNASTYLPPTAPIMPPYPDLVPAPIPVSYRNAALNVVSDGADVTIATVTVEGVTASASSKRARGDKFDSQVGELLAVSRALRKLADRLDRRARGRMRHLDEIRRHKEEIQARWEQPVPYTLDELMSTKVTFNGVFGGVKVFDGPPPKVSDQAQEPVKAVSTTDVRTRVELDNGKVVHVGSDGKIHVLGLDGQSEHYYDAA